MAATCPRQATSHVHRTCLFAAALPCAAAARRVECDWWRFSVGATQGRTNRLWRSPITEPIITTNNILQIQSSSSFYLLMADRWDKPRKGRRNPWQVKRVESKTGVDRTKLSDAIRKNRSVRRQTKMIWKSKGSRVVKRQTILHIQQP